MLLNGGMYAHQRSCIARPWRNSHPANPLAANTRTLGWKVPTERLFERTLFFDAQLRPHWIHRHVDVDRSNEGAFRGVADQRRVHANLEEDLIRRVQPAVHDTIVERLELAPAGNQESAR